MCVTAVLAGLAVVGGGMQAIGQIQSANANAAAAVYQADMQNKMAKEARDTAEIQALEQENARTSEFQRARSAALAAIGASGLGEQISFFQSIDPDNQAAYLRDVRNVRLNLMQTRSTIADQIQVNNFGATIARANAASQRLGAIGGFIETAMGAANFYVGNKKPS